VVAGYGQAIRCNLTLAAGPGSNLAKFSAFAFVGSQIIHLDDPTG